MLKATAPLGGYDETFGDLRLWERAELALVSLAIPLGGETAAKVALKAAYKLDLPAVGHSSLSGGRRLIRTSPDQALLVFPSDAALAEPEVRAALGEACYTTNQTDAWIALSLDGPEVRAVLERLCPLDLHPDAFAVDQATRTVMEHMGVLICREGADHFTLFSASSSAGSFLHALQVSVANGL